MMAQPSAEDQIAVLAGVQRILSEGQFTATYKFALLMALADLAVELGDDSGAALAVPTLMIAEKFVEYYWRHVIPYIPGPFAREGVVLQQNTLRQAAVVNFVREARSRYGDSLPALRQDKSAWLSLVKRVEAVFWEQPLWRLQRIAEQPLSFLYENQRIGTRVNSVTLLPGVAFSLRRFHALITELIRGAWLQYVRKYNAVALGNTTDLSEFLFGSDRENVMALRPVLREIQRGKCFYCPREFGITAGHLDHFIPWARYPVDLGHNFVLAHDACNGAKGMMLASEESLGRWAEQNELHGPIIQTACVSANIRADWAASLQIARWAYGQAFEVKSMVWVRGKELRQLGGEWENAFTSR